MITNFLIAELEEEELNSVIEVYNYHLTDLKETHPKESGSEQISEEKKFRLKMVNTYPRLNNSVKHSLH